MLPLCGDFCSKTIKRLSGSSAVQWITITAIFQRGMLFDVKLLLNKVKYNKGKGTKIKIM
jgi:hypothetical protein